MKNIVTLKHRINIKNMKENQSIIVLKQDNGREVVIMNCNTNTDKYFSILMSSLFT